MQDFKLVKLTTEDIDNISKLEESAMKTDTTYPFTKQEIIDLFNIQGEYIAYGYKNEDGLLIWKV